jgi:hypothetical protein
MLLIDSDSLSSRRVTRAMLQTSDSVRNDLGQAAECLLGAPAWTSRRIVARRSATGSQAGPYKKNHRLVASGKDYWNKTTRKCVQTQEMAKLRDWQTFCSR